MAATQSRPKGGSRHPYFLFSGTVSLTFKETRDIRIWTGDARKTIEDFAIFNLKMEGVASLPSGMAESFTYSAESDGGGFTVDPVVPSGHMTVIKKLYTPIGHDYPYPTVYAWGKGHEKCRYENNRPLTHDSIDIWLLPGWGADWSRSRGGFQYRHADRACV